MSLNNTAQAGYYLANEAKFYFDWLYIQYLYEIKNVFSYKLPAIYNTFFRKSQTRNKNLTKSLRVYEHSKNIKK